jgi:hypothetical protein
MEPHELAKPTLNTISLNDPPAPLGNHNCGTWMCERGRHCPDIEGLRPNALPLSQNGCKLRPTSQAVSPRKNEFVRRWRTLMAAEQ